MSEKAHKMKSPGVLAILALGILGGIPLTRWWLKDHGNHPFDVLTRAKKDEQERVLPLGRADLACAEAEIRHIVGEVWVGGCGKRARYVLDGDKWRREGDVERDETSQDNCRVRWRSEDGGAGDPKEIVGRVQAQGQMARVRIPIARFDVPGFKKLRYGENVDTYLKAKDTTLPAKVPMPCVDPEMDGGYRDGVCEHEWSEITEVDACDE